MRRLIIGQVIFLTLGALVMLYCEAKGREHNRQLLHRGVVIQAEVLRVGFEGHAPAGWQVRYRFTVPQEGQSTAEIVEGRSKGPRSYYEALHVGDRVAVIYDPSDPDTNAALQTFVTDPENLAQFHNEGIAQELERLGAPPIIPDRAYRDRWYAERGQRDRAPAQERSQP